MSNLPSQSSASIARNTIYGALTWLLPLALSLAVTPLLYRSLGTETYGIYVLVIGLISYSFNFGIGRAVVRYISAYRSTNEVAMIRGIFSATLIIAAVIGSFGMILILLLADVLVSDVLRIDAHLAADAASAIRIAAIIIFFSTINQVFWSVLQGAHRFDIYSKLFNANSFLTLGGTLVLAILRAELLYIFLWNLLSMVVVTAISAFASKKAVPEIRPEIGQAKPHLMTVLRFSSGIIGYQILGNVLLLFERGWIVRTMGADVLAYYVIAMSMGMYLHGFSTSLTLTITPLASETQKDPERLLLLYKRATKFILIIVAFIASALLASSGTFLTVWIGQDVAANAAILMAIHVAAFSLHAISIISWQMREGLGVPGQNFLVYLLAFLVNVLLLIWLSQSLDATGAAIARFVSCAIIFLSILQFELWLFKRIQTAFWARLIGVVGIAFILGGVCNYLLLSQLPASWIGLLTASLANGIIYVLVLWMLRILTTEERALLKAFLGKYRNV